MKRIPEEYATYIKHPRYGRGPRFTALNPETVYGGDVFIHWHSSKDCRIPNTAIAADLTKQMPATVPVTHYYDVKRQCVDCGKGFIFFAVKGSSLRLTFVCPKVSYEGPEMPKAC